MNEERTKDFIFVLYMLVILAFTILYFTVPERIVFISNAIDWWLRFLSDG